MKNLVLPTVLCFLLACSGASEEKASPATGNNKDHQSASCYAYQSPRDTIRMTLLVSDNIINGKLHFNFFEKDQNTGTLTGLMRGDTLFADYRFMSEGVESVSEVVFLKKGDTFVQGYGEMADVNGKTVFKDRGTVQFGNSFVLEKRVCDN